MLTAPSYLAYNARTSETPPSTESSGQSHLNEQKEGSPGQHSSFDDVAARTRDSHSSTVKYPNPANYQLG